MCTRQFLLGITMLLLAGAQPAAEAAKASFDSVVEFLLGGDQWQPGERYRAGSDWLALVCMKKECSLEPAKLAVHKEKWQGHYDETPTNGQKLIFSRQKPGSGTVLGWFRLNPNLSWLKPGPVTTYAASTSKFKRPASVGTLELAVDLPDGKRTTLVPLYDKENRRFLLQMREPGKRQLLEEIGSCSHLVTADYLVWAGDLDLDGKPDYLINFADEVGEAKLYLGKEARPKEIVGVAGVYVPPPFGGECDGEGWLY